MPASLPSQWPHIAPRGPGLLWHRGGSSETVRETVRETQIESRNDVLDMPFTLLFENVLFHAHLQGASVTAVFYRRDGLRYNYTKQ